MKRKRDNDRADLDEQTIRDALSEHKKAHPGAKTDIQRRNSVSIRIRITDPDFEGLDLVERDNQVWKILEKLPEDVLSQISLLLLLTPKEAKKSLADLEFDRPVRSSL
jgi:stress-induced morphogen